MQCNAVRHGVCPPRPPHLRLFSSAVLSRSKEEEEEGAGDVDNPQAEVCLTLGLAWLWLNVFFLSCSFSTPIESSLQFCLVLSFLFSLSPSLHPSHTPENNYPRSF